MTRDRFNILLGVNHSVAFDRRAFAGIANFGNERGDVRLIERLSDMPWREVVRSSSIHGIIVSRLFGPAKGELEALGIPFVSLADVADIASHQYVVAMDEQAIGAMAARHFLDAGYQHYAVCVRDGIYRSLAGRVESFKHEVEAAGWSCVTGPLSNDGRDSNSDFEDETTWAADAVKWIADLPKPLAIFAPYDYHARVALTAAQSGGFRVPDDVAVLGVDDDDVYCMTTSPQLSSVVTPGRHVGQLALETLLNVLQGKPGVPKRTLIQPPTIIVRGSSSGFALQDADVIGAVRYIRENVSGGVTVDQVANHVLLSRRTLERRFLTALSHTIRDEIRRAKIARAKRLLIDTDLAYAEVARRSGLVQQQQLNRLIKAATGKTPVELRKAARTFRSI